MTKQTFLDTCDDISWLVEVHLTSAGLTTAEAERIQCAILEGNDDCPERVSLYAGRLVSDAPFAIFRRKVLDMERAPAIDHLAAEFRTWAEPRGYVGEGDALELLMLPSLSDSDRQWLSDFVARWDAAEAADPAFHDRQTAES